MWDEASTREAVKGRSGDICENCWSSRASDMHHRKSRGVGGKFSPANILHLCRKCHQRVTDNPEEAYKSGLSVRSHHDPQEIAVQCLTGIRTYLSDDVTPPAEKRR